MSSTATATAPTAATAATAATAKRDSKQTAPLAPFTPPAPPAPVRLDMSYFQICELRDQIANLKRVLPEKRENLESLKAARRAYDPDYRIPNRPGFASAEYHKQHHQIKLEIRELEEEIEDATINLAELEARMPRMT